MSGLPAGLEALALGHTCNKEKWVGISHSQKRVRRSHCVFGCAVKRKGVEGVTCQSGLAQG